MKKQMLIVRKDLNMRKGKIASQCAHASMGILTQLMTRNQDGTRTLSFNSHVDEWLNQSFTKICLYVTSEQELLDLAQKAKNSGLLTCLITDNGTTEFKGVPTNTVLAIGPGPVEILSPITGHLPLL